MEDLHFESESGWTISSNLEVQYGENKPLKLNWSNTMWHRHLVGDGEYDYIDHMSDSGEKFQFFIDNTELAEALERYNFPFQMMPFVEPELIEAKRENIIFAETASFRQALEGVVGLDDLI